MRLVCRVHRSGHYSCQRYRVKRARCLMEGEAGDRTEEIAFAIAAKIVAITQAAWADQHGPHKLDTVDASSIACAIVESIREAIRSALPSATLLSGEAFREITHGEATS